MISKRWGTNWGDRHINKYHWGKGDKIDQPMSRILSDSPNFKSCHDYIQTCRIKDFEFGGGGMDLSIYI